MRNGLFGLVVAIFSGLLLSGCNSENIAEIKESSQARRDAALASVRQSLRDDLAFLVPLCVEEMEGKPFNEAALLAKGYEPSSSIFGEKGAYSSVGKTIAQKQREAANGGKSESSARQLRASKYKYIRVFKNSKGCIIKRPLWTFSSELYPSEIDHVMQTLGFSWEQREQKVGLTFGTPKYLYTKDNLNVQVQVVSTREVGETAIFFSSQAQ